MKTSHNENGNLKASLIFISSPALIGSDGIILVLLKSSNAKIPAHNKENTHVALATNKAVPKASCPDFDFEISS